MAKKHLSTFPELLSSQLPGKAFSRRHFWVDYMELLCIAHIDSQISKNEVIEHIRSYEELIVDDELTDEIEELMDLDETDEGHEGDLGTREEDMIEAEKDDKWQKRVEDWLLHMRNRQELCKEYYPFTLDSGGTVIKLTKLYPKKKLYITLLLCSALNYLGRYNKKYSRTMDSCFELISYEALKHYVPNTAIVRYFGRNKYNTSHYRNGSLWERLNKLANELQDQVIADEKDFAPTNNGDAGIDLVAWIPFNDNESAFLSLFGQCTCRSDWENKQHETDYETLRTIFRLHAKNSNALFVPYFLRDNSGCFYEMVNIRSIIFDRPRILQFLDDVSFQEKLDSYTIVEEIIKQKDKVI